MARIELKFSPMWREPMLSESKTVTTRRSPHGKAGDTFAAFGRVFMLRGVEPMRLHSVAALWFYEEGCELPEDFIAIWNKIYPKSQFGDCATNIVYLHKFMLKPSKKTVEENRKKYGTRRLHREGA